MLGGKPMLNLKDGTLWQWDTGRKIIVTLPNGSNIDKVQFYNGVGKNAFPATSIEKINGEILAGIPNSLLCHAKNLTVYLMATDENGVKTQEQITLVVNRRAKPEDYIFEDDEFRTYQVYDERLQYLEENIVVPERLKESTDKEVKALVPGWARESAPDVSLSQKGKAADANSVGVKISDLDKEIKVQKNRIDNLAKLEPGSSTVDAEVIDGRVDYLGATHDSLGDSIRGQGNWFDSILKSVGALEEVNMRNGYAIINSGEEQENSTTASSDFVEVIPGSDVFLANLHLILARSVCGYNENKEFVQCFISGSDLTSITITIPQGIKYIRFNSKYGEKAYISNKLTMLYTEEEDVRFVKSCLFNFDKTLVKKTPSSLTLESTNTSLPNHKYNVWLKECKDVEVLKFKVQDPTFSTNGFRFFVSKAGSDYFYFYNLGFSTDRTQYGVSCYEYNTKDDTYKSVENSGMSNTPSFLTTARTTGNYDVTIRIAHGYAYIYLSDNYLTRVKIFVSNNIIAGYNFRAVNSGIYLNDMSVINRGTPYAHISIDDTTSCLKDITDNSATYTSIFDNFLFAKLRDMHVSTGAVFSLYVLGNEDIDLSTVTTKFKSEFLSCSHWLKFGVHSPSSTTHYAEFSVSDFMNSYQEIRKNIINFSSVDNVDNMPRLGFYSATKTGLVNLKELNVGFVGTLTADDDREDNVGLNSTEREILTTCDSYYDKVEDIYYCRTSTRLDDKTEEEAINVLSTEYLDRSNNNIFIFFFHEPKEVTNSNLAKCEALVERFAKLGIRFDYPEFNVPKLS